MNSISIIGRLGRDMELKYTGNGKPVGNFSIAVDKKTGQSKKTFWLNIVLWDKQAETLAPYLKKGKQVAIQGELDIRTFQDRDGNDRLSTEVIGRQVTLLSGGADSSGSSQSEQTDFD